MYLRVQEIDDLEMYIRAIGMRHLPMRSNASGTRHISLEKYEDINNRATQERSMDFFFCKFISALLRNRQINSGGMNKNSLKINFCV